MALHGFGWSGQTPQNGGGERRRGAWEGVREVDPEPTIEGRCSIPIAPSYLNAVFIEVFEGLG
jgi:hypothetical protein